MVILMRHLLVVLVSGVVAGDSPSVCVCDCYSSSGDKVPLGNCQPQSDPASCNGETCYASQYGGICLSSNGLLREIFAAPSSDACNAWIKALEGAALNGDEQQAMQTQVMSGVLNSVISNKPRVWYLNVTTYSNSSASAPVACPGWSDVLKKGCNGKCVQDCVNGYIFEKGEGALEQAACDYVTAGSGAAFCSKILPQVLQPVNDFVNKHIEKPIVEVAGKVEDAVAHAAESFVSWLGF